AAQLLDRMILKGTVLRPADRAIADLRALGASIETSTSYDGAAYSVVSPAGKIKDALTIQADVLQNPSLDPDALGREISLLLDQEKRGGGLPNALMALNSRSFTTRTLTSRNSDQ